MASHQGFFNQILVTFLKKRVSAIKAAAQVMITCKPELFGTSSPDSPKSPKSAEDHH